MQSSIVSLIILFTIVFKCFLNAPSLEKFSSPKKANHLKRSDKCDMHNSFEYTVHQHTCLRCSHKSKNSNVRDTKVEVSLCKQIIQKHSGGTLIRCSPIIPCQFDGFFLLFFHSMLDALACDVSKTKQDKTSGHFCLDWVFNLDLMIVQIPSSPYKR